MRKSRYRGRPCRNHPELDGLRYRCNSKCVECARIARREQVARAKLKQQAYLARAERDLKIVRELGLEDRLQVTGRYSAYAAMSRAWSLIYQ